ncbi:hypothetical protein ABW19_dt0208636 [Dactylella cylindrospora]|nr:hypothetical protein ABW19_dt0208636 [Dactylella cylindrospora]
MGRQMEASIHSPSVGGQTANSDSTAIANGTPSRDRILALMTKKEVLEGEINALSAVLDSHGVNMQTPLTTFDGYPRDDIDVAQIRTTRARIIPLVNDMKALMSEIEKALHDHHAEQAATATPLASTSIAPPVTTPASNTIIEAVFATVNTVFPSSPAEQAGLKVGDKVKRFGSVGALNHDKLARVAVEVQQNEGRAITVLVSRPFGNDEQDLELSLTPRRDWGGRGMLGCQLLPL